MPGGPKPWLLRQARSGYDWPPIGPLAKWHIAGNVDDRSVRAVPVKPAPRCAGMRAFGNLTGSARLSRPGDRAATASLDAPPIGPRPTASQRDRILGSDREASNG